MNATEHLADYAATLQYADIPDAATLVSRQCFLDILGVALAGARNPVVAAVRAEVLDEGGNQQSSLVYWGDLVSRAQAARVNGVAAHVLDYDDGSRAARGHMSAPIASAVLALAQATNASGQQILTAFVAGYETACMLGIATNIVSAYETGWHATPVIGTVGAAIACGRLLGLDTKTLCHAIGIAATQSSGLKSMFGTMCKPFHSGMAAENGLRSACLAGRGFTSCATAIEADQGFASVFCREPALDRLDDWDTGEFLIIDNLFKFHAACHFTHSAIEAAKKVVRSANLVVDDIESGRVLVSPASLRICNIEEPNTGLESKFSYRQTLALALQGYDTSDIAVFSDANAVNPSLVALRRKLAVEPDPGRTSLSSVVELTTKDGVTYSDEVATAAVSDLSLQTDRLADKFQVLTEPILGTDRSQEILESVLQLDVAADINHLMALTNAMLRD